MTVDDECLTCGGYEDLPDAQCIKSQRPCGHHCNHSWTHDVCDWCGKAWEADDPSSQPHPAQEQQT